MTMIKTQFLLLYSQDTS